MKIKKRKYTEMHSHPIPIGAILNPLLKTDREKIVGAHESLTYLWPPENALLSVYHTLSTGFGVIANQFIKRNRKLCTYYGEKVKQKINDGVVSPYEEVTNAIESKKNEIKKGVDRDLSKMEQKEVFKFGKKIKNHIQKYLFVLEEDAKKIVSILGHKKGGIASLVNCSWNGFANVEAINLQGKIIYKAMRDINPGEEILIDYSNRYLESVDFMHIFPIGSRSIKDFLEQNAEHYSSEVIFITKSEQLLLGVESQYLLAPNYYLQPQKLKSYKNFQINILPFIEVVKEEDSKFEPLKDQQFISSLMYACVKENKVIFDNLIKKNVCVNFVTKKGHSAWYILSAKYGASTCIQVMCLKLAKAIFNLYKERDWLYAYDSYIKDNMHGFAREMKKIIFSDLLIQQVQRKEVKENKGSKNSDIPKKKNDIVQIKNNPMGKEGNLEEKSISKMAISEDIKTLPMALVVETKPAIVLGEFDLIENLNPVENKSIQDNNFEEKLVNADQLKINFFKIPNLSSGIYQGFPLLADAILHNRLDIIQAIFKSNSHDTLFHFMKTPFKKGKNSYRPIELAVMYSDIILDYILKTFLPSQNLDLLTIHQSAEFYKGFNSIAIALQKPDGSTLKIILENLESTKYTIELISSPQKRKEFEGCNALVVAINSKKFYLEILLPEVIRANRVDLIRLPASSGAYQGYSLLEIAVLKGKVDAVSSILKFFEKKEQINLITKFRDQNPNMGMNILALSVGSGKFYVLDFLLKILDKNNQLSVLDRLLPVGEFSGCNLIAVSAACNYSPCLNILLNTMVTGKLEYKIHDQSILNKEDQNKLVKLISTAQAGNHFDGLSLLTIPILCDKTKTFSVILNHIPGTKKLELLNTPILKGCYRGCTPFVMALINKKSLILSEMVKGMEISQKVTLITTCQADGEMKGLTALSIAVKFRNSDLLGWMLKLLPFAARWEIFNNAVGEEKNLTMAEFAANHNKIEDVITLFASVTPLMCDSPQIPSLWKDVSHNSFSLFGVSQTSPTLTYTDSLEKYPGMT